MSMIRLTYLALALALLGLSGCATLNGHNAGASSREGPKIYGQINSSYTKRVN